MTLKETYEYFKEMVDSCGAYELCPCDRNDMEMTKIALFALEKQIPKKPSWVDSVPHSRCPACHNAVVTYIDSPKLPYCHWCGQALDWEVK